MIYQNGNYRVEINNDGAIRVKPGDWLSKYSAAIYNNFHTIQVFARRDRSGALIPIRDLNLIHAGETLYHVPTFDKAMRKQSKLPLVRLPSDADKKKIIENHLKKEFNIRGENLPIISKALDIQGYAETAATLAEIVGLIGKGGAIGAGATALSIAGVFALPITMAIGFLNSAEFQQKLVGMRAIAYGTTAWAFRDPMPSIPSIMYKNISSFHGKQEADLCERAWNEARDSAVKNLNDDVVKQKVKKKSYQIVLRAIGGDNRNSLVKEIMMSLEKSLTAGSKRQAFWSPKPDYPN